MKKFFLIFLTILFPISIWAAGTEVDGIHYSFSTSDLTCSVTYTGSSQTAATTYSGDITIPSTVDYDGNTYTVTSIGQYAFYGGTSGNTTITSINLPSTITSIGTYAFGYCKGLLKMEIPNSVETMGDHVLYYCSSLEEVTLPENIEKIDNYSFQNCYALKEITIPERVTSIGNYAFKDCNVMETATLGSRVSSVGIQSFYGCSALISLTVLNSTPPTVSNSNAFTNIPTSTCILYVPSQSVEAYQSDTYWSVFTNIEEIGLTLSIETLEATDIFGTSAMLNGNIDANGQTIIELGFQYYYTTDDVQHIIVSTTDNEFSARLTGLSPNTTYTYYAYVLTENGTTYGNNATFTTSTYDFIVDGFYYYIYSEEESTCVVTYTGSLPTSVTSYEGDIVVPEEVEYNNTKYTVIGIGDNAFFYGKTGITSISLPNSIEFIGKDAFSTCTALTEITIPEKVTTINDYTLNNCEGLTIVNLPDGLISIGEYSLQNCQSLTSITIPDNVTTISQYAFADCSSLTSISLGKGLISLGGNAFRNCYALESITIPENVEDLGEYTFSGCYSLVSINIPDKVTTIGRYTFYRCSALEEIKLPAGVTSVNNYAFDGCGSLGRVYSYNIEPPTCGTSVFSNIDEQCVLCVPNESIEYYATADTWSDFFKIIGINDPIVNTLDATDITLETAILNGAVILSEETDEIVEQGFEYWVDVENKTTIEATSVTESNISVPITNLNRNTEYTYRAYAKTPSNICYGEEVLFTTANWDCDFYVDGFYYDYATEGGTCLVTYRDEAYNSYFGIVNVPEKTTYHNVEYTIVGVGASAFRDCAELTFVTIPETSISIGIFAFYNCVALTEVMIPNAVVEIGNQAFNGCENLATVTIGASVENIGNNSFNCSNLAEIYSLNATPPTCNQYAFKDVDKNTCVLYVPHGAYNEYSSTDVWKDFYNIVEMESTGIDFIETNTNDVGIKCFYTIGGQKLNTPQKGVNIVRYSDGTTKKILIK